MLSIEKKKECSMDVLLAQSILTPKPSVASHGLWNIVQTKSDNTHPALAAPTLQDTSSIPTTSHYSIDSVLSNSGAENELGFSWSFQHILQIPPGRLQRRQM